jgi:hypothetical protein
MIFQIEMLDGLVHLNDIGQFLERWSTYKQVET